MSKRSMLSVLGFGAAVAVAGVLGAAATNKSVNSRWYKRLEKPRYQPPREAFGPVWTTLYALMAGSAARVHRARPSRERSRALWLWGAQLALNVGWSAIFFGARKPKAAVAEIGLLLAAIAAYTYEARSVDKTASRMMWPYLGWTTFAAALNADIARRN